MVANGPQEINVVEWMGKSRKTALELIGQAGLEYPFGTLEGKTLKEFSCV